MRCNTAVGEVLISDESTGRSWFMRPSFLAVSSMGTPKEVMSLFERICTAYEFVVLEQHDSPLRFAPFAPFYDARKVIESCMVHGDAHRLVGRLIDYGNGVRHKRGAMPYNKIITISYHLMKWAVAGNPKGVRKDSGESKKDFDVSEFVGAAMGHLDYSPSDAWSMTMTEFQRAMEAKYPEQMGTGVKEQQDINQTDYDALMKQHDEIKAKLNG